ncbi:carboxylesterase/lipase family protein [Falsirhodobacter halotolerans]|uniref:carboxylesterase/lipase family protein n=1 Tax=Falsirhodobacter halotolerans TaxID=1146892 RepID=UPI001FD21E6F|nr:carboxylesterase family protein [Falsirhodobacter halotolerans]MCJ8141130.1 carboxylesterase family protein [Falsirhodobacter halotolerans]
MIVQTAAGALRGRNGAFLGVPYAAPVTDCNRFDAPTPMPPWAGVRDATRLGPVCPQVPTYGPVGTAATSALTAGEDFRTVNIRTPDPNGRAPVLVWIHGGGYAVGSANEPVLQSGAFAASGIVEVTVNYRLGAMGFLHVPGRPDNRGLLDIVAALEWVRDTIAAFGGDPGRVTLAGRSAGGFAVAALMAMPAARGLFARAMPQSGAATAIAAPHDAGRLTRRMCDRLGTDDPCHVPLPDLLTAQRDLCNESYERHDPGRDGRAAMLGVPFVPVLGPSLPVHPLEAARQGRTAPVPMMIGCTSAEYLTHATALPEGMTLRDVIHRLDPRVRPMGWTGAEIVARYAAALPDHSPLGLWRAIAGDLVFQNPATEFARAHAAHQPVWKYLYGPCAPDETGAPHGAEVGAVWYRRGMDQSVLPKRQRVADPEAAIVVHDIWAAFIKGAPNWTPYTAAAPWVMHVDGTTATIRRDPFDPRPALWTRP